MVLRGVRIRQSEAHGEYEDEQLATAQKTDIFDRVFALRLVIVYQGLVRIPESKNIRLWWVRKFIYEKLYSHGRFKIGTANNKVLTVTNNGVYSRLSGFVPDK